MKRECEGLPRRKPEGSIASGLFSAMLLSKAELASIGSVVVEATYLERQIEELLWHLAGMTPVTGANFTQNMQMKSRIEMLRVLGRHHFEAGSEGWADLEQLARDLDAILFRYAIPARVDASDGVPHRGVGGGSCSSFA